jgi:fumarylacetoacetate (FAA) hydrolase
MRLATVIDVEANERRPVFELPGGARVELRELFTPKLKPPRAGRLSEMPLYFSDLTRTVQYMDDVVEAVRQWATERSEMDLGAASADNATNSFPFCPPIPMPRTFRSFAAFCDQGRPSFMFANVGSLLGHDAPVFAPLASTELDFGLELGVIIGRPGRNISACGAWKHVAGFTIVNRFVARDLPPSKSCDFATAVGPYLVTLDSLRDRIDSEGRIHLNMTARVNGREVSRGDATTMHSNWPAMIEYASRDADLFPGDLLASGTVNSGCIFDVGQDKFDRWLRPGDIVDLEIERLGVLRTPVVSRPGAPGKFSAHETVTA